MFGNTVISSKAQFQQKAKSRDHDRDLLTSLLDTFDSLMSCFIDLHGLPDEERVMVLEAQLFENLSTAFKAKFKQILLDGGYNYQYHNEKGSRPYFLIGIKGLNLKPFNMYGELDYSFDPGELDPRLF
jgi:hypothetical protein